MINVIDLTESCPVVDLVHTFNISSNERNFKARCPKKASRTPIKRGRLLKSASSGAGALGVPSGTPPTNNSSSSLATHNHTSKMNQGFRFDHPAFVGVCTQVCEALANHTHIYVGNEDDYDAIPQQFRTHCTQRKLAIPCS